MVNTSQLVEGQDTVDIAVSAGGVSNPGGQTFLTPNGGQRESSDTTGAVTIGATEFVELEFALQATDSASYGNTYCFRIVDSAGPLPVYTEYAELNTREKQDFFVQRGTTVVSGASQTLTAGADYDAPADNTRAFVRITDTNMTGAGNGTTGAQDNPDNFTAYIENASNLQSSFTIARPATAALTTRVSWEIIEYVGIPLADNEMIVRDVGTITYGSNDLIATGTPVTGVADDADVVVYITGQVNPDAGTDNYNTGLSVSSWSAASDEPVFERGDADAVAAGVSYAVVEYTGLNWNIQRVEHTYAAAGITETEAITTVNSLGRTFIHAQKLAGDELFNLDEGGHQVWLSSIGFVSFQLQSGSTNPSDQRSVAWVIENTQTDNGAMLVQRITDQIAATTVQPSTYDYAIPTPVNTSNATLFVNNDSTGAGNFHPRVQLGATILSSTTMQLFKADEGQNQAFRAEVVEWPVANTALRQNYYRWYVDNDTLTPTDPWPLGTTDLPENAAMTATDEPIGDSEIVRLRMTLEVKRIVG